MTTSRNWLVPAMETSMTCVAAFAIRIGATMLWV